MILDPYRPDHRHWQCRCDDCRRWRRDYMRAWRRSHPRSEGRVSDDVRAVRTHIQQLMDHGWTQRYIEIHLGLPRCTVWGLWHHRKRVKKDIRDKILGIPLGPPPLPTLEVAERPEARGAKISHIGATRRLRALMAVGWSTRQLSQLSGIDRRTIQHLIHQPERVHQVSTYWRVGQLYDQLTAPERLSDPRLVSGHSTKTRLVAAARDWAGPGAWDEDTIDNPDSQPVGAIPPGRMLPARAEAVWLVLDQHGCEHTPRSLRPWIRRLWTARAPEAPAWLLALATYRVLRPDHPLRRALELRAEGLTWQVVAGRLGISTATLRVLLARGLTPRAQRYWEGRETWTKPDKSDRPSVPLTRFVRDVL